MRPFESEEPLSALVAVMALIIYHNIQSRYIYRMHGGNKVKITILFMYKFSLFSLGASNLP